MWRQRRAMLGGAPLVMGEVWSLGQGECMGGPLVRDGACALRLAPDQPRVMLRLLGKPLEPARVGRARVGK